MSATTLPLMIDERARKPETPQNVLDSVKKYYQKKKDDPEYVAYHRAKALESVRRRYAEDEAFREKTTAYYRERQRIKRQSLQQQRPTLVVAYIIFIVCFPFPNAKTHHIQGFDYFINL
jgi:hypothetical protein